jgi:hypothetical protein
MKKLLLTGLCVSVLAIMPTTSVKAEDCNCGEKTYSLRADSHAPIGIMRDHMHKKGEWMISARTMRMEMEDNSNGTSSLSPEEIATTVPNRFFDTAGQPPTLRVVPTKMTTDMVMLGGMYAPTDTMTLMIMANYIDREMDHITFQGGAGTTRLGTFTTKAKGWGDTKIGSLIRLYKDQTHHLHFNAGLSLPTGSIKENDDVLAPNGTRPTLRLPYAMQLGSGTYDLLPGITYNGSHHKFGWGAQYSGTFRLGHNSQDYSWGDKHQMTMWGSYLITPAISVSARISAEQEGQINDIDSQIVAPVQTADPDNYGGRRISTSFGINSVVPNGILKGHRFSTEVTMPIYQNLNGPQLERDHSIVFGWSKAF